MSLAGLTFLSPLALFGLLALPLIWLVLRLTPPKPLQQIFPPLRLLAQLPKEEETPKGTPWWLLLMRIAMGALLAFALAHPILNRDDVQAARPSVLIIDNGWGAAANWPAIMSGAEAVIKSARRDNRQLALVPSIDPQAVPGAAPVQLRSAQTVLEQLKSLPLFPYAAERNEIVDRIQSVPEGADILWFSDGIDYGDSAALRSLVDDAAAAKLVKPQAETLPVLSAGATESASGFRAFMQRLDRQSQRSFNVSAYGSRGQVIARAPLDFSAGAASAEANFELPAQLRNQVTRLQVDGVRSAAASWLFDDSWGRPLVGLLMGSDANVQPLLSEWHYVEKALSPHADIFKGDLSELLSLAPSIIFMSDRARDDSPQMRKFVEEGGLLVRFGGPRLARRTDALLPVAVRGGDRTLGGALAWEDPQQIADFPSGSPFFGLAIDPGVTVNTQIMARPSAETDSRTWARLKDGAPIVTSDALGLGRIVFFHVSAGPDWSGLPLSGLYVDMLKRILPLARARSAKPQPGQSSGLSWTLERALDAFGRPATPMAAAPAIPAARFDTAKAGLQAHPGLYKQGLRRAALNVNAGADELSLLAPSGWEITQYGAKEETSLMGHLLAIFAVFLAIDVFFSLIASGRMRVRRTQAVLAILIASGVLICAPQMAAAQDKPEATGLYLAYLVTGDSRTDEMSRAGLEGLREQLTRRTTIEPAGVRGVRAGQDDLAFYPFIYWPVPRDQKELEAAQAKALNEYMAAGGTLLLDTQDEDRRVLSAGAVHPGLKILSKSLDIPRLVKAPTDHVITKSFYLLQVFAGRWAGGDLWVDADRRGTARDGVSSVILGSNDWSAAWAVDDKGRGLVVMELDIPRQREMAIRFGVNLAMYSLAGNYKADQVHAAALIERLGTGDEADKKIQQRPGSVPENIDELLRQQRGGPK